MDFPLSILLYNKRLIDLFCTYIYNSKCKNFLIKMLTYLHFFLLFFVTGIIVTRRREENVELIYKKYFGSDYEISYNGRYGSIISNHISWTVIFNNFFIFFLLIV